MTTPRDEATALLAEALHTSLVVLLASPVIDADLAFTAAWRRVERALPERPDGRRKMALYLVDDTYTAQAFLSGHAPRADGPTPTAALTRLAETLEAMR